MNSALIVVAFFTYTLLVFTIKRTTYRKKYEPPHPFPRGWEQGHEYTIAISQDFWWAKRFKSRIKQFEPRTLRTILLQHYVKENNCLNLRLSVLLTLSIFGAYCSIGSQSVLYQLLLYMGVIRFVSRSFEILYAFSRDVLQQHVNTTGLKKFERIKLALFSYIEIFFYSAGAYLALPSHKDPLDAIWTSLNVGTLTNVGFAFPKNPDIGWNGIVFIQVFATLSLVVLSLASYLSREE